MSAHVDAYVALGSNVDPAVRLRQAAALLRGLHADIRFSACYQNVAVGFDGADFINAVAVFATDVTLPELVSELHAVEERCGRRRDDPKWAPRAMDLDVLLLGVSVEHTPGSNLPRADLLRRAYMLGPAAELAPRLLHPQVGRSLGELWRELQPQTPPLRPLALDLNAEPPQAL